MIGRMGAGGTTDGWSLMDLILHIGCEKTGTTSLQNWLQHNAQALPSRKVFYSKALGRPNNRRLTLYGLETGRKDELLLQENVRTPEEHEALRRRVKAEFTLEVEQCKRRGIQQMVISNEHLQSRCYKDENVEPIRDLLVPLFDTIRVYIFVRPQMDTCLSLASTMARNGAEVSRRWMDDLLKPKLAYFDMQALMERWAKYFGRESIVPVPFRRCKDIVTYFEQQMKLAEPQLPREKSFNEALDYRVIAMCNAMQLKGIEDNELNQSRRFYINDLPVDERLSIDRDSAQVLQARFDETNAALCREWPQIQIDDMNPDWSRYPEVGNIDKVLALQEFGPFLRYIVERFNGECWWHQARWAAAAAEREGMAARLDSGIRTAEFGIRAARHAMKQEIYVQKAERMIENLELRLIRLRRRREREEAEAAASAEAERLEEQAAGAGAIL
jgi:hypothetical protein